MPTVYIKVPPEECKQTRNGRLGTPCFREMQDAGVTCGLMCPEPLATATDPAIIWQLLNDGTCLMDERNPTGMGAYFEARARGSATLLPEP